MGGRSREGAGTGISKQVGKLVGLLLSFLAMEYCTLIYPVFLRRTNYIIHGKLLFCNFEFSLQEKK